MFYGAKRLNVRRFNAKNGFENIFRIGAVALGVWKFPQVRVHDAGGPLANEEMSAPFNDECNKSARSGCDALAEVGQFLNAVFAKSDTELFQRTRRAIWISRRANQRAEFHQGLIQSRT